MRNLPHLSKKINGNTLKVIACIVMLIDHIAAGIMLPIVRDGLYDGMLSNAELNMTYKVLRAIGRSAFPIFCFLLTEGFIHTRDKRRYAAGLLIFAIISEPFFDLTLYCKFDRYNFNIFKVLIENRELWFERQNVFFTLFLGLVAIGHIDRIRAEFGRIMPLSETEDPRLTTVSGNVNIVSLLLSAAVGTSAAILAQFIHSDYRWYGVTLIIIFYVFKEFDALCLAAGYFFISSLSTEYWSFPAFILMLFYNKKRGRDLGKFKYCFYLFYPVHLLVIYLVRCIIAL
jgi:hypothetical protein